MNCEESKQKKKSKLKTGKIDIEVDEKGLGEGREGIVGQGETGSGCSLSCSGRIEACTI